MTTPKNTLNEALTRTFDASTSALLEKLKITLVDVTLPPVTAPKGK
jgi:hypothetical protein